MKFRFLAMIGVMSLAGLGLVGAGAHAVFTTSTSSGQQVTAATLNGSDVYLTSDCAISGNGTANITLTNVGPVGSDFMSAPCLITVHNDSPINISYISIGVTDSFGGTSAAADTALQNEMWMCFYGPEVGSSPPANIVGFNETVGTLIGDGNVTVGGTIGAGLTDTYNTVFYAGTDQSTGCGGPVADYSTVPQPVAPSTNSSAATLGSDAEGGVLTTTLTLTYSG
jgi:hypothetical protein